MKKRSVIISGHATSVSIEQEFWDALKLIACRRKVSMNLLISEIDRNAQSESLSDGKNLSSLLRLYVLKDLQSRLNT